MNFRLKRVLWLALYFFTFSSLMRVIFYFAFRATGGTFTADQLFEAFVLGARFDLRMTLLFTLPLGLISWIPALEPTRRKGARVFWQVFYLILTALFILFYFVDFGYFSYLQGRLNATILLFLQNPLISLQMLWESYNVIILLMVYGGLLYGFHIFFKHVVLKIAPREVPLLLKLEIPKGALIVALFVVGLHGSFRQYPLRWSDAFFVNNGFITSLALNPIHYFFDTLENAEKDYDTQQVRRFYDRMANYLKVENKDAEALNFRRPVELTPRFTTRPNIVYIVMESMAAYKTGVFGNPAGASPSLDQLARDGILFTRFFTPVEGTARSLFCVMASIPDMNATSTSSRNPLVINQHTLINAFQGYQKFYFIGGSAAWGNIRGVYKNNIPGLELFEEDQLQGPRTDVWGLSDLDLFREAARILGDKQEPFFAVIQSASYHRPYTIPEEHGDFEIIELSDEELSRYGFKSNTEFNSFRFQDYSLGEFFRLVRNKPFFQNAIFVIHGDHGLPHHNAPFLKKVYKEYELNRFHVPLVIYSPLIQQPERRDQIATEMDVLPTLAGLTGHAFTNTGLGRNLFAIQKGEKRYAFSYVYYSSPIQIFLYDEEFLLQGRVGDPVEKYTLHRYMTDDMTDISHEYPDRVQEMYELANGFYETGKWMLFHNPNLLNSGTNTAKNGL